MGCISSKSVAGSQPSKTRVVPIDASKQVNNCFINVQIILTENVGNTPKDKKNT